MTATPIAGAVMALVAMALAGCTGGFQVDQTEPFRVQLEGAPETVTVRDSDTEAKRVVVETCGDRAETCDVEEVEVQLKVTQVTSGPCKVLVTVQDEDGNTIMSRIIDVAGNGSANTTTTAPAPTTGNTTSGNTTNGTVSGSGQVVVQNLVVNVKGNKNIVVVTQAQQGTADIAVQAVRASGHAQVDGEDTGSQTPMPTSTGNATTSGP